jgi:hypothetical protein
MPQPLRLTDSELDAVTAACRPLAPERRDAFLQQVANTLKDCREIGDGVVSRVARATVAEFRNRAMGERPRIGSRWSRKGGGIRERANG